MNPKSEKEQFESGECFIWFVIALIIAAIICQCTGNGCSVARAAETKVWNISAYCPCEKCCQGWSKIYPRRTASGHLIKKGDKFVAADLPFGTMISIPGYNNGKPVPVLDRGGAIKGNRLDVYYESHAEALKWGRQYLKVRIEL